MTETTINTLKAQFDTLKDDFKAQENAVETRKATQAKNTAILEALKQELKELLKRSQDKLANGETPTADEYVELKQSETGLKARIEYYGALSEDLDTLTYNECKKLFDIKQTLSGIRAQICSIKARERIQTFNERNQKELAEIFALLFLSGEHHNENPIFSEVTDEEITRLFLEKEIGKNINTEYSKNIPNDLNLYSKCLVGFEPKSPTKTHIEEFQAPKGLAGLLSREGN